MNLLSGRTIVLPLAGGVMVAIASAGVAEAWPVRGPVARAERRVFRAQLALERELNRPLVRGRVIEVPTHAGLPGGVPGGGAGVPAPAQVTAAAAQVAAPLPVPAPGTARRPDQQAAAASATPQPGVARTAFETPAPAADGTVSVLIRPEAPPAASSPAQERAAEPLLFPGTSQP